MEIKIADIVFNVNSKQGVTLKEERSEKDFLQILIEVEQDEKNVPEKVEIMWKTECCDVFSQWSPTRWDSKCEMSHCLNPEWKPTVTKSKISVGVPIQTFLSQSGENRMTAALSDVITPVEISSGICEIDKTIKCTLTLFTERVSPLKSYRASLRIDRRKTPYYDCIYDAVKWWDELYGCVGAVPEEAKNPLYSTWYSYHQNIDTEHLLKNLEIAKTMGIGTVIVDDGWQTDDSSGGYAYCGDWEVTENKIPDINRFIDDVHSLGMKIVFWYSVPYIGKYSKSFERFKDRLLDELKLGYSCFDIRYPDIRKYIVSIYKEAQRSWGLDGFKLDFIDSFALSDNSTPQSSQMDSSSVEDAVYKLLNEIHSSLFADGKTPLIEFRQNYIGPVMRKFGNMLRVADVPNDPLLHRVRMANLRMISGNTPVHSDMLTWNKNEKPQQIAIQMANVLFAVPQISIDLNTISEEKKKTLTFYLDFWQKNRDCILEGRLVGLHPEANYSVIYSYNERAAVLAAYSDNCIKLDKKFKQICLINATDKTEFILDFKLDKASSASVYDCYGNENTAKLEFFKEKAFIEIPIGGIAVFK